MNELIPVDDPALVAYAKQQTMILNHKHSLDMETLRREKKAFQQYIHDHPTCHKYYYIKLRVLDHELWWLWSRGMTSLGFVSHYERYRYPKDLEYIQTYEESTCPCV